MKKHLYLISFVCFSLLLPVTLVVQVKGQKINARIDLPPDPENLDVFQQWIRWNNPGSLLIDHLIEQAMDLYEIRDREIARLNTRSEWMNRQSFVKQKITDLVGPFPEKTPLNPKITGTLKRDGYRIEKIVYEAMPRYYVTGCLYVPEGIKGKVPAIVHVIGHDQNAFRAELYQVISYNLVMKGMMVFAIDPPGQGEHIQYFDPGIGFSSVGYTVIEHSYFGNQCFLSGSSAARYFIWEGIRAIDYLVSRKDVDPERIGVTGFSGGGTITSYLSAFDDRVKVSNPCSWSTASRRQLETKGAQDAETEFIRGIEEGITFEDLLEVRAPKPTLMTSVSRDQYLTLQGAREAFAEAKKAYKAFGLEENIQLTEDDSKHWLTPKIRLDIYSFFMKHFNIAGDPSELEADLLSIKDLQVTPTGQISTSYGGNMVFDVNKKETEKLIEELERSRKDLNKHIADVKVKAKVVSGYISPSGDDTRSFINGKYKRDGYSVGKYAIMGEGIYPVPFLLFVPDGNVKKHPALIYLNPKGKVSDAAPGGEIEKLVRRGYVVAATDVIGIGETKNTATRGSADGYTSVLIGRSIVAIQASDIVRIVQHLKTCNEVDPSNIGAMGLDEMCIPLIHAAAFEPSISKVILIGSPASYRSIAMNRIYRIGLTPTGNKGVGHLFEVDFSWGVAGVLKAYDLPDLIGCLAPRKIVLAGLRDHAMEFATDDLINQEMAFPRSSYAHKNADANLKIVPSGENRPDLVDWCFK